MMVLAPAMAAARQPLASIVVDGKSGDVLHAVDADARRYPASLTKMMTIYLAFEALKMGRLKLSTEIPMTAHAAGMPPSKLGLEVGERIKLIDALGVLVTKSANDVAAALAEYMAGSEAAFARRMTAKARQLGMRNTVFRNASGLPDGAQVTTARDMARLGLALFDRFPRYYRIFKTRVYSVAGRRFKNHNRLLGRVAGVDGIKTGYTRASGFNLASSLRRDGKHIVAVVMGHRTGRRRNAFMRRLLAKALPRAATNRTRPVIGGPVLVAAPRVASRPVVGANVTRRRTRRSAGAAVKPRSHDRRSYETRRLVATAPKNPDVASPTHQVQIGAFFTEAEARRALTAVQARAGALLAGFRPIFIEAKSADKIIFRARFAGFNEQTAYDTCLKLKTVRVECFATRTN